MKKILFLTFIFASLSLFGQQTNGIFSKSKEQLAKELDALTDVEFISRFGYLVNTPEFKFFEELYSSDYIGDTLKIGDEVYIFNQSSMKQFPEYMFGKEDLRLVETFPSSYNTRGLADKGYVLHFSLDRKNIAYVDRAIYEGFIYPKEVNLTPMDLTKISSLTSKEIENVKIRATWLNGIYRLNKCQPFVYMHNKKTFDSQEKRKTDETSGCTDNYIENSYYLAIFKKGRLVRIIEDTDRYKFRVPVLDIHDKPKDVNIKDFTSKREYQKNAYYLNGDKTLEKIDLQQERKYLTKKLKKMYKKEPFLNKECINSLRELGIEY